MNVMTLDQIIEWVEDNKRTPNSPEEILKKTEEIANLIGSLSDLSEMSKEIVLRKISEEKLVRLMRAVEKMVVFAMSVRGEGENLILPLASNELDGYTHSVVLATLGILINEEVL